MVACPVSTAATSGALPASRRQPSGALKATPACGYLTVTVGPVVGIDDGSGALFLFDPQPAKASTGSVSRRARRISALDPNRLRPPGPAPGPARTARSRWS